jgi:hypothetical protein
MDDQAVEPLPAPGPPNPVGKTVLGIVLTGTN